MSDPVPGLNPRLLRTLLVTAAVCAGLVVTACCLWGCAAGRGPAGEVIVGWDVAKLPETAAELGQAAAGFLPPPFDLIAGAGVVALTGYAAKKKGEDKGWDMATGTPPQADIPPKGNS